MALPPDILVGVSTKLAEHAGLELPGWVVDARASARIASLELTPAAYLELISSGRGHAELGQLVESVRVGESSLFRHLPQVAALVEVVAPELRARGKKTVRVWSAGCAAGEEPYTLAIVLSRELPGVAISVVATDVSAEALEAAGAASYPREVLDDVPDTWRAAFVERGDRVCVRAEIAKLVRFEQANLLDAVPPRGCDVVWCRNVLIYFSADARRRVIDRLVNATVPGGFVFVGYSESLREVAELEQRRTGDAVFYMRRDGRPAPDVERDRRTPVPGLARPATRTPTSGVPKVAPPVAPVHRPLPTTASDLFVVAGAPDPATLVTELTHRLRNPGLAQLTVDLDSAELLGDDLAPVLRRARAAAGAAGVELVLRATRTGARRWLTRHGFEEGAP